MTLVNVIRKFCWYSVAKASSLRFDVKTKKKTKKIMVTVTTTL